MLKIAGKIIDVHDDADFGVLLSALPAKEVRKKYAGKVDLLDERELADLPESRLGAIFFNSRTREVEKRAYPLNSEGHAELSAIYFEKAAGDAVFPDDVRNQIAAQIRQGLAMWGLDGSELLNKWAEEYGQWQPGDNFIDLAMVESPSSVAPESFAFSKDAGETITSFLPCSNADETIQSISGLLRPHAAEDLGLSRIETTHAASALKFAAEAQGVEVPPPLMKLACVDTRPEDDVQALLRQRFEMISEDMGMGHRKLAQDTIQAIQREAEPEKRAGLLESFDRAFGIGDRAYGRGAPRPFDVFFQSMPTKAAAEQDIVAGLGGMEHLKFVVGEKKASEFEKDPKTALKSLKPEIRTILQHASH